ncbi:MAG TPA: twin-arginine translocation signal domain-containing protein [Kiritimatiellae bacterium]|nr:twin-arginine translocation signal domain-containing protein [Kiritimatiellia bacterium]
MEPVSRRAFIKQLVMGLAGAAALVSGWVPYGVRTMRRWVRALPGRRFPGRVQPLDTRRIRLPGPWSG